MFYVQHSYFKKQLTRLLLEFWPIIQAIILLNYFSIINLEQQSYHHSLQVSWYISTWPKETEKKIWKCKSFFDKNVLFLSCDEQESKSVHNSYYLKMSEKYFPQEISLTK